MSRKRDIIDEAWAISYSDVVSLLLVFFVMLLSISTIDPNKLEEVNQAVKNSEKYKQKRASLDEVEKNIKKIIKLNNLDKFVSAKRDALSVKININDKILFPIGSAKINDRTKAILAKLISSFKKLPKNYTFQIEGHTDDVPINTAKYPSNWHLSTDRALSILWFFRKNRIKKDRLSVQGFADTKPLYPFKDKSGRAIMENKAKNRRITIKIR